MTDRVRIGFIPLIDAVTVIAAVDMGFCAQEGIEAELVREVSWSNVRDKLNIGLFDAAHLLAPVAIASSLGLGHVKVPIVAAFGLGLNGNAITVSPALHAAITDQSGGAGDPMATAKALAEIVARRRSEGKEPLTFGMTFPYSMHNYQLRFWMAAAGIDPDRDVRLVVLPPPYMVKSLASAHVDGFCVGAPWNSIAVESGVGHILHFGCEIVRRAPEKVLAVCSRWAQDNSDLFKRLLRAHERAARYVEDSENHADVAAMLAKPDRVGVPSDIVRRTLEGNLRVSPDGAMRTDRRYYLVHRARATRPDPVQAAWLYAQMVRWGQAPLRPQLLAEAKSVFRSDLFDGVLGSAELLPEGEPADRLGAFAGPAFDADDLEAHLRTWTRP